MPVIGSSLVFSCATLHDGVIRRSALALGEITCRGISFTVWKDILDGGMLSLPHWLHCYMYKYLGNSLRTVIPIRLSERAIFGTGDSILPLKKHFRVWRVRALPP